MSSSSRRVASSMGAEDTAREEPAGVPGVSLRCRAVKALLLRDLGGPASLRLEEVEEPEAADGVVVIDVHAAGVGFVDMLVTRG